jgi:ubiquinone biosynthesis protein Coq4
MRVSEAREQYFAKNGFSTATYTDRWAKLKLGPIPLAFPNTKSRQRAIPMHDLHHIATGYDTTFVGEAEIGAWEIGGGCGPYLAAWVLNGVGMLMGLVIAPLRTIRAFRRGRKSTNLYQRGWSNDLLDLTVDELRALLEG